MRINNQIVIFDLETTGTWTLKDRIIEIAMIKIKEDGAEESFFTKVNPGIQIPKQVEELTGIKNEDVKDKPKFSDISSKILKFINTADLAGFNIKRFDLPLLEAEFNRVGMPFNWKNKKVYDCYYIFSRHYKRNLEAAYKIYCNKQLHNAHSAIVDTAATLDVLKAQVRKYSENNQLEDIYDMQEEPISEEFFDQQKRFRIWNGEVYFNFGKYYGASLDEVAKIDNGYLEWISKQDFEKEVKDLINKFLN